MSKKEIFEVETNRYQLIEIDDDQLNHVFGGNDCGPAKYYPVYDCGGNFLHWTTCAPPPIS